MEASKPHISRTVAAVDALRRWSTTPYERDLAFSAILANAHDLEEQLEAARTDLAEGWTIIWLEDAPYVGDGDRKLDAWAERMQAKYGFDDDSFPAMRQEG